MKIVFLKQGNYELNPAIDAMGSVGEFYNDRFFQFSKISSPFKLNYINNQFGFYDIRQGSKSFANTFKVEDILEYVNQYDVLFFGKLSKENEFHSNTSIIQESKFYTFDQTKDAFKVLNKDEYLDEKNLLCLAYFFKINSTNAYLMILNHMVTLDVAGYGAVREAQSSEASLVVLDSGNSVRSRMVNLKFSENIFPVNHDPSVSSVVLHVKEGEEGSIKLFNENSFFKLTDEFVKGFDYKVQSNLQVAVQGDEIKFHRNQEKFGYIKVNLTTSKLYNLMTEGNPFERLEFIFYIL